MENLAKVVAAVVIGVLILQYLFTILPHTLLKVWWIITKRATEERRFEQLEKDYEERQNKGL